MPPIHIAREQNTGGPEFSTNFYFLFFLGGGGGGRPDDIFKSFLVAVFGIYGKNPRERWGRELPARIFGPDRIRVPQTCQTYTQKVSRSDPGVIPK